MARPSTSIRLARARRQRRREAARRAETAARQPRPSCACALCGGRRAAALGSRGRAAHPRGTPSTAFCPCLRSGAQHWSAGARCLGAAEARLIAGRPFGGAGVSGAAARARTGLQVVSGGAAAGNGRRARRQVGCGARHARPSQAPTLRGSLGETHVLSLHTACVGGTRLRQSRRKHARGTAGGGRRHARSRPRGRSKPHAQIRGRGATHQGVIGRQPRLQLHGGHARRPGLHDLCGARRPRHSGVSAAPRTLRRNARLAPVGAPCSVVEKMARASRTHPSSASAAVPQPSAAARAERGMPPGRARGSAARSPCAVQADAVLCMPGSNANRRARRWPMRRYGAA